MLCILHVHVCGISRWTVHCTFISCVHVHTRTHTHTHTQGLELSGEGVGDKRSEVDVSTEMILSSPELVLTDPTSSVTGRALRGLLTAQSAVTVSL